MLHIIGKFLSLAPPPILSYIRHWVSGVDTSEHSLVSLGDRNFIFYMAPPNDLCFDKKMVCFSQVFLRINWLQSRVILKHTQYHERTKMAPSSWICLPGSLCPGLDSVRCISFRARDVSFGIFIFLFK